MFSAFKDFVRRADIDAVLKDFIQNPDEEKAQVIETVASAQTELSDYFQNQVQELLAAWYPTGMTGVKIRFDSDQRVVWQGDISNKLGRYAIKYFPHLIKEVNGSLSFIDSYIPKMDFLEKVSGNFFNNAFLHNIGHLQSIKRLRFIGGNFKLFKAKVTALDSLEIVGGEVFIGDTPITSLKNLTKVGGDLDMQRSIIQDLRSLETVGGNIVMHNVTTLSEFPNLREVKGGINVSSLNAPNFRTLFPKLKKVNSLGNAYSFWFSDEFGSQLRNQVKSLSDLDYKGSILGGHDT